MKYSILELKPNTRRSDELQIDAFVDWYSDKLACDPLLIDRPDRLTPGAIDGVYQLGSLRLAIEHTSLDELPDTRKHEDALQIVRARFEGMLTPRKECVYTFHVPHGFPARSDANKVADELAMWFSKYGAKIRPDNQVRTAPQYMYPIRISARMSAYGRGKVYITPGIDERQVRAIDGNVPSLIRERLAAKLPKLIRHSCDANTIRILVIQNNEVWRACKHEYAPHVRGWLHRNIKLVCDEIWAMEHVGAEVDCTLL
jgi:hypothetical protein